MVFDIKVIEFMHFQNFILQAVRDTVYFFLPDSKSAAVIC